MRRHYPVILALVFCVPPAGAQERDLIARVKTSGEVVILDKETGIQGKLLFDRKACALRDYWSFDGKTIFSCGKGFAYKTEDGPIEASRPGDITLKYDPETKPKPGTDDPGPMKAPESDEN